MSRLIVNADDFGRSAAINQAVIKAHQRGILTTASLMVSGAACQEAVEMAHQHPTLGVGLHLSLVRSRSVLPAGQIPDLVDSNQNLGEKPALAGLRYFFQGRLRPQLRREIEAQFDAFGKTGLRLDHVNGHLHLHLHPTIFGLLAANAREWGVRHVRLTRDPLWLNLRLARGAWGYRLSHAVVFGVLARRALPLLRQLDIRHTHAVFGLLQSGRVNEEFVAGLLRRLPAGDSELYAHPTLEGPQTEFQALTSPRVKALIRELNIQLLRYQDLSYG